MAELTLTNIRKFYDSRVCALDDVSLEVEDRELLVIVGPSGCGKTTLLRLIAGLESLDNGEIALAGTPVQDLPPQKRNTAIMFQNYVLLPHMTAFDNMAFGLKLRKVKKKSIRQKVTAVAETLGISSLLERYPHALSGGQRQRIALGRAILRKPDIFLLDEPLSNLDARMRSQMRVEIRQIQKRLQTTMVFVTHDQTEAMTMGDRIAVMNKGRILQIAPPETLYHRPETMFTASFIGSPGMNFIKGSINGKKLINQGLEIPLPKHLHQSIQECNLKEIVLGIRPENISISTTPDFPENNAVIAARLQTLEYLGAQICCTLCAGTTEITIIDKPQPNLQAGAQYFLHLNLENACIFNPQTENAISTS